MGSSSSSSSSSSSDLPESVEDEDDDGDPGADELADATTHQGGVAALEIDQHLPFLDPLAQRLLDLATCAAAGCQLGEFLGNAHCGHVVSNLVSQAR